ncbi:uncharacterized protein TrAFT101_007082 [Trichoderma asperellum]|uniref:uncharacterized protein n=1 Tax=Trichoderma asperellum TaxID=101201 RepID=UPI0033308AA1|nr:hypothetical protein TrAFT101_007082 [Trichoderma asperellum]
MDEERRTKIAAALQQYRETVSQQNLAMLRVIVDGLEAPSLPPSTLSLRSSILVDEYGTNLAETVKEPRDLFNDNIRPKLLKYLDGVVDGPNLTKREEYFARMKAIIAEENIDFGGEFEFPPRDLAYLCTLVDGIIGPGLPDYIVSSQIEFISPTFDGLDDLGYVVPLWDDDLGHRVDMFFGLWEDWEIAVAIQTGRGPFALCGSCAIYCRNEKDDDNKEWKWRYGMFDGDWHSDMYNTVEEFLAYYRHHNEQTEEMVRRNLGI